MDSDFELLPMGDSRTLFLHKDDTGLGHHCAVQVSVFPSESQKRNVETSITYALAQRELSELVTKLVTLHVRHSLPESFTISYKNWSLNASRKEWSFGKRNFKASWGIEPIIPSGEKWKFVFWMHGPPAKTMGRV
ncbi:hypothetical protein BDY19DRAFT_955738 [Irpex rosettiformis]|uniref:Uncharacterized protein n=1 Tax=Irpex rosettiformis TaxID=378272 RepID=A0ACB8TZB7_9APHY|nr:hypothetical protein BDY19DRAFT_955738 [Irpex rosettiformis]